MHPQAVLESLQDAVVAIDGAGGLCYANRAARARLVAEDPAGGLAWTALGRAIVGPGHPVPGRRTVDVTSGGQRSRHLLSVVPLDDAGGESVTTRDITEEARATAWADMEHRRRQTMQTAVQLANGLAHMVNNPVQALSSNLTFLEESVQLLAELVNAHQLGLEAAADAGRSADLQALRDGLAEESSRAGLDFLFEELPAALRQSWEGLAVVTRTVARLHDFAAGRPGVQGPFDVNAALQLSTDILQGRFDGCATLTLALAPGLPCVPADGLALRHALHSLVVRALDAVDRACAGRGAHGHVVVSTRLDPNAVVVELADDGAVLAPETLDRLFDPLADPGPGDGGLDLAFAHHVIVAHHGGQLTLTPQAGGGALVRVRLPMTGSLVAPPAITP
jgi:signal transduction histidine kinase